MKYSAQYEDKEKSEWLEERYKYCASNRPRHRFVYYIFGCIKGNQFNHYNLSIFRPIPYEVYDYERIFLIDRQTKPLKRKLRPFYFGEQIYHRSMDYSKKKYIPRKMRDKYQPKFHPGYWPK